MPIIHHFEELARELTAWRRELHAHPQTAFEETYASDFVAARLEEAGIRVRRGLAKTGVVGTLDGSPPSRGDCCAIALRADLDALDIHEQNEFPHRSLYPGKMHACGHDGHTVMLLGAARHLAETRRFAGKVRFIFQPAEENEGGGRVMVEEGLFDEFPVDAVFGLHNWPGIPVGEFAVAPGPLMAAFDVFEIRLRGVGGHAALPHLTVDPVVVASHLVTALQTIASRGTNPLDELVVTVTQVHAGETWNVIPDQAVLRGTVRTLKKDVQETVEPAMRRIIDGVCAAFGAQGELRYERRYPATVNSERETRWAAEAAADVVGREHVCLDPAPCMGSEDFAFMLQERPGCYIWMGNGPSSQGRMLHNPRYDFNDEAIPVGASYWVRLVERLLPA